MKKIYFSFCLSLTIATNVMAQAHQPKIFKNPLLNSGADPWVTYRDGYYYYTNSTGKDLQLWKTKDMTDLKNAQHQVIWTPPAGKPWSKELWAPEIHYINHKWYMYFAADDGENNHHRLYVIENSSADPMRGRWAFKGQITDETNKWAIDASVFENKGMLYMIWAGWDGDTNGEQDIFIARLKNPCTIGSKRVKISSPTFNWEKYGDLHDPGNPPHVNVNEGPEILKHNNKLFLVYSASGCWTDYYALGMLTADANSDLLDQRSWAKSPDPVFKQSPENKVYATGHNSFFKSPDGKQDWILYHANPQPGMGCGDDRSPRAQQFTWHKDGTPDFGKPLPTGIALAIPSGTP
ncbi:family 43 glycosylhydrolase [Mucilaginibacter corticis]|uniref:Family 43 glycosylhydrolase n=1 Tax=Mucilaginibacter corticis TaxID=2597670 RepID=A0A556M7N6_9SPHI|nr:glycoside hydrolase family 43 protein [Mucilaginibacter corticis]TSJ35932.1 family 43 glycosylhydrolase [Mucilaginibacter corticis]